MMEGRALLTALSVIQYLNIACWVSCNNLRLRLTRRRLKMKTGLPLRPLLLITLSWWSGLSLARFFNYGIIKRARDSAFHLGL